MVFPSIRSCLLCEDVRRELYRKATILGFYGIAPHVLILLKDFKKPLERLSFLLNAEEGGSIGSVTMDWRIVDSAEDVVFQSPEGQFYLPDNKRGSTLFLQSSMIAFRHPGTHRFQLRVEGKQVYETKFELDQGTAEDFRD